jgi:pimeloyl-ACP methyl ester carboxylesterase
LSRYFVYGATALLAALLIIPLLLPQSGSGTMTHQEAAPADAQFITVDGLDVHIRYEPHAGELSNPPLFILMHGFGASVYSWREVMVPLTALGDVLAYDRPAFGWTSRDTSGLSWDVYSEESNRAILSRLINEYAREETDIILVGHSAGGGVAVNFALSGPDAVSALILVAPAIGMPGGRSPWLQRLSALPQVSRTAIWLFGSFAERGLALLEVSWHDRSKLTPEIIAGYTQPTRIKGWEQALWSFSTAPRSPVDNEQLAALSLPALIITGDDDRVVPTERSIALAGLLPNTELVVIPASGHLPQEETHTAFLAAIELHQAWLNQVIGLVSSE